MRISDWSSDVCSSDLFIVGREGDADMAIVKNGIVLSIGLLDLVEALGDEEGLDPIASHEGECAFKEIEPPERRKFIEHQQQPMRTAFGVELLGQAPADLVEDQANERLGTADVDRKSTRLNSSH